MHTNARPPCPDRLPCRPALNRTSESCPKCTSLRAQPVPTAKARNPAVRRAANPPWNETRHAAHAGAAGTRPCILSRKACSGHCFAHFLHSYDIFCALLRQKRPANDSDRILLRESMPISCHEKKEKFFKVRPIRPKQAFRYPIDTLSIPDFSCFAATLRHTWTLLGLFWTESAPFLHTCAALPTRVLTPPLTSTLISARADRSGALRSPQLAQGTRRPPSNPSPHSSLSAEVPGRAGMSRPRDDARAMLAPRARSFCASWPEIAVSAILSPNLGCTLGHSFSSPSHLGCLFSVKAAKRRQ